MLKPIKALSQRLRWTEAQSQYLLAALLLLLLPLLAILQYRWLGQLSESEQKQMRTSLQAAASRFGEEFDHEMTDVFAAFLPEFGAEPATPAQWLTRAYANWHAAARYPQLVKTFYYVSSDDTDDMKPSQLSRFDLATQQMLPSDWPPGLEQVMQKQFERLRVMAVRNPGEPPPVNAARPLLIEPRLPAFLIPQPMQVLTAGNRISMRARPFSFVVVLLNQEYIAQQLLPTLARRHFGEGAAPQYFLAISDGKHTQPLLQSATPMLSADNADLSTKFFGLRTEEMRERFRRRSVPLAPVRNIFLRNSRDKRVSPLPSLPPPPGPMMGPVIGMFMGAEASEGVWQLHVRHQAGSLATAVTQVRRRNLLLSSSILLLLAGSIFLLVRSSRRARQLAQQQMDFVAGVSHELRTPITVIDSAAYNLAQGVTRSPEQMRQYGQMIRKQTRQLREMIEQVLEFAGMQSGRQPYQLQPVQLHQLLDEFAQANQPLLAEQGFQLQLDIAEELPTVQADAAALRRALQNLLNNAMKYSGESRWIGLQAAIDNVAQPTAVVLSVRDHGLGITTQDLPHICEPFYRGTEVRAAQIHGNGLGLSLVQNIVKAHGGKLEIDSRAGHGSTFSIRLPLAASVSSSIETASLTLTTVKAESQ